VDLPVSAELRFLALVQMTEGTPGMVKLEYRVLLRGCVVMGSRRDMRLMAGCCGDMKGVRRAV